MLDCRARIPAERPRRKEVREWRVVRICFVLVLVSESFGFGFGW